MYQRGSGYFDKDVVLHRFVQGKKFCNFFSFTCMTCKRGGDFIGGYFPKGDFSRGHIFFLGGGVIFSGGGGGKLS